MDELIISLLDDLLYVSKFKTWVCIQLADLAAQSFGYRSTRHIAECDSDSVLDKYDEMLNQMLSLVYEFKDIIMHRSGQYKHEILYLSRDEIECLLSDIILQSLETNDCYLFNNTFFE